MELEKGEPRESLGDARDAKASLVRHGHTILEIRVPEILCKHRFAIQHDQSAQPNVALPTLDVGQHVRKRLTSVSTSRQLLSVLRPEPDRRNAHAQHQNAIKSSPH
jgi:hypothetical protein